MNSLKVKWILENKPHQVGCLMSAAGHTWKGCIYLQWNSERTFWSNWQIRGVYWEIYNWVENYVEIFHVHRLPKGRFTHSMPCPCRAHAVPLPCRAAKSLEYVFPIWFTQCGRVWFTLAMPCSDHAFLLKATAQHGRRETAVLCSGLEKNGIVAAWHGHGLASVNQTRPHCVNQIGKTHSKPLAARRGRGAAWARHAMCESVFNVHFSSSSFGWNISRRRSQLRSIRRPLCLCNFSY